MRILAIDTETTGVDILTDRIIEVGAVLYDTEEKAPLSVFSAFVRPINADGSAALELDKYVSPTGIKGEWLGEFGRSFGYAADALAGLIRRHKPEAVVGHNIVGFDLPIIHQELAREEASLPELKDLHVLDTRHDLPFSNEPSSRKLIHLSAEYGKFINPFEHRAVFDCMACLKLLEQFDFNEVLELSKIPWTVIQALVSYDDRQKAKDLRFSWERAGDYTYPKMWVKQVRENAVEREEALAAEKGFKIKRLP